MSQRRVSPTVALIIIVAVALILTGTLGPSLKGYLGGGGGGEALAMSCTLHYEDGTEKVVDSRNNPLHLLGRPLTITDDSGRKIQWIGVSVTIKLDWKGTLYTYKITGTIEAEVNDVVKQTWTELDPPDPLEREGTEGIYKGEYSSIFLENVYASTLEGWCNTGDNTLEITATITATLSFTDGSQDSKQGTGNITITLRKEIGAITAITIMVYGLIVD